MANDPKDSRPDRGDDEETPVTTATLPVQAAQLRRTASGAQLLADKVLAELRKKSNPPAKKRNSETPETD